MKHISEITNPDRNIPLPKESPPVLLRNKVIARPVKGTREWAYFERYAKEHNEFPSVEELVAYMEEE